MVRVNVQDVNNNHAAREHDPHQAQSSAIVSGDSDGEDIFDDDEEHDQPMYRIDPSDPNTADELYDENLDDEDEAYVYKNLRGGVKETVSISQQKDQPEEKNSQEQKSSEVVTKQVYKPRTSDAVLSCPCCFNIVCMDCQRHERYMNQYRAMFVMGIVVDWDKRLIYDEITQSLVDRPELPNQVPPEESDFRNKGTDQYFSVMCANCQTQVAALDMSEEIYYFFGCLESQ